MKKNKEKVKEILKSNNIGLNFLDDNYLIPLINFDKEFIELAYNILDLILEDCKDGLVFYSYYRDKYTRLKLIPKITEDIIWDKTLISAVDLKQNLLYTSNNPSFDIKYQFIKNIAIPILSSYLYPCKKYLPILRDMWEKIKLFFNFKYKKELKRQQNMVFDYFREVGINV